MFLAMMISSNAAFSMAKDSALSIELLSSDASKDIIIMNLIDEALERPPNIVPFFI